LFHTFGLKEGYCKTVNDIAKKNNLILTHMFYYINLASEEKQKVFMSRKRIIDAVEATFLAGGYSVTFHAAYYQKVTKPATYNLVKTELKTILKELKEKI
jgi:deoxyribonuclease-4